MNFRDTAISNNFSKALYNEANFDFADVHTIKIVDVTLRSVAEFLSNARDKDIPVAVRFVNFRNNEFVAAAVLMYMPGEGKDPGNWNFTWMFNEADIPAGAKVFDSNEAAYQSVIRGYAGSKYQMAFKSSETLFILTNECIYQLKKWLDENASEKDIVEVNEDDLFIARVGIEGGEKQFSLEVDGEIKNLIKDDAAIEK